MNNINLKYVDQVESKVNLIGMDNRCMTELVNRLLLFISFKKGVIYYNRYVTMSRERFRTKKHYGYGYDRYC